MSLKSFFKKIVPGKEKEETEPFPDKKEMVIQYEMPFEKMDTRTESVVVGPEIEIYINNEKNSIHSLGLETKIGRDPAQCDVVISELVVSKLHCTIYSRGEDFFIKDNHSTNGVIIGTQRVTTDRQIEDGDVILLGKKGTIKIIYHKRR
jgi:pSer/pThr/pTyr-binding forkhead associated (FHA) protein